MVVEVSDRTYLRGTGELLAATATDRASFFGFYDICPWGPDEERLVMLTCPAGFLSMPAGELADVCVWHPESGEVRKIGETRGWNWQHGARQRWLRGGSVLFNDVVDGRQCARIVDMDGRVLRTIDTSISALNPAETLGVAANYARLNKLYNTYGYGAAVNDHIGPRPEDDGLWAVDMASGNVSLLLSYDRICRDLGIAYSEGMFASHPDFSPSGDKVEFFLIQEGAAGTAYMRLLVYQFSTDRLSLVTQEKASHPAWIDDDRLWTWARESSAMKMISRSGLLSLPGMATLAKLARRFQGAARNALMAEGFFIYQTKEGTKRRIAPASLVEDGHYSKHPTHELMLGDTYPDQTGYLTLLLYSLTHDKRVDVARIFHGVHIDDPRLRCDLHPRWHPAGDRICIDFCENGVRRIGIVDAKDAIVDAGHG